jgi:Ca2+-transporting ATPase
MPAFFRGNPTFFGVMGVVVIIQILIVQYGGSVFNTVPLPVDQWIKIIVLSASVLVVGFVLRHAYRQYTRHRTPALPE